MNLDLRLLRTFLAVAQGLSFRRAAESLHYAPSTVTVHIQALEQSLGARLFDRLGRRVLLTDPGRRLLPHALKLLDQEAATRRALLGEEPGHELTVRVSETLALACLPQVLPAFRRHYPTLRLTLLTASRRGLADDLRHGATDLALILSEPFTAPDLVVEELGQEPLTLVVAATSPLARRSGLDTTTLRTQPLYLTPHVWSLRQMLLASLQPPTEGAGVTVCSSLEVVKGCVRAGLGVGVAPLLAVEEDARQGRLVLLPWSEAPLRASVLLLRHGQRWQSPASHALAQGLREFFSSRQKPDSLLASGQKHK